MSLTISPLKQVGVPLNPGPWKRRNSDAEDGATEEYKRARLDNYWITLQSESSSNSSGLESEQDICGWHDQETEFARDTSDLCSSDADSDVSKAREDMIEYEPDSDFDAPNNSVYSSSDHEEFSGPIIFVEIIDETGRSADGSSDDSRSSYDSEISPIDYWKCVNCNQKKNNPRYSRCEKCFRQRKELYPPRPRGRKKRNLCKKKKEVDYNRDLTPERVVSCDSGLGSSQASSQEIQTISRFNTENISLLNSSTSVDTVDAPTITNQLERSQSLMSNELTDNSKNDNDDSKCESCFGDIDKRRYGAFVHGKDAHIRYCYPCSKKMWETNKNCPICKRKVTNVIKAFYS